jgi:hypothetical protein
MADDRQNTEQAAQRVGILSKWDDEDGAQAPPALRPETIPELTNTELVQLRIRVIALENLMISMLSRASDEQLEAATELASCIRPRSASTPHPLTISAADHMNNILHRARHLRTMTKVQGAGG